MIDKTSYMAGLSAATGGINNWISGKYYIGSYLVQGQFVKYKGEAQVDWDTEDFDGYIILY